MTNSRKSSAIIAGFIILAASFLVLLYYQYRLRSFTWDDSYITYRHALNMARGLGPVYNPGERADGITNYLLAWILSFGIRIHIDPLVFSKWLGIVSAWGILIFAWFYARRRLKIAPIFAGIATLLLATNGMFAVESAGGLETALFTLVVFWIMWEITSAPGKELSTTKLGLAGIASGIAMLIRPDAAFFIAVVILLLIDRKNLKGSAKRIGIYLLPVLVIFLPYFIKHWIMFGYPFPNSYYAQEMASINLVTRGFDRLFTNLGDIEGSLIIILIGFGFYISSKAKRYYSARIKDVKYGLALPAWFIVARCLFIVLSGGAWMGWGRFLVPILPQVYVILLLYLEIIYTNAASNQRRFMLDKAIVVLFSLFILWWNYHAISQNLFREANPSLHLDRFHIPLGLALKDTLAPTDSICFGDAGALPYYADVVNIDPAGLCDRHIAHLTGEFNIKTDPEYILNRRPVLIILNSIDPYPQFNPQSPIDKAIVSYPRLQKEYEFIFAFEAWSNYNLWLFARKDRASELKTSLMNDPHMSPIFKPN